MLADVLNPTSYMMVNRQAVKVLGLNTAVYCTEILTIYTKVVNKKKFVNEEGYFKVDRNYIEKQTSLTVEDQLKCDINLKKVDIVAIDQENPDIIYFNQELYASLLASEDVRLQQKVSEKVKIQNPKGLKATKQERIIAALKESIECKNIEILIKLRTWVDSIFANDRILSKQQIALFKEKLDDKCDGDVKMALEIIDIAIAHSYTDCQWAINIYDSSKRPFGNKQTQTNNTLVRPEPSKRATSLSDEVF